MNRKEDLQRQLEELEGQVVTLLDKEDRSEDEGKRLGDLTDQLEALNAELDTIDRAERAIGSLRKPQGERPKHLFDVRSDPGERDDLATQRTALTDSLHAQLLEWIARYGSEGAMAARDLPEHLDPAIREQLEALGYIQ